MTLVLSVLCLVLLCSNSSCALSRQKRVVGGQPANPPPPGASEAEDVVENPALASVQAQPVKPPPSNSVTTTRRPVSYDDDGPIVFLERGSRKAQVKGVTEPEGINAFKGIRYAEPPVGTYRFQRPRRTKLVGEVEAKKPGPPCPQTIGQKLVGSEDCLFLNIYTPKDIENKKYPVIFWIHGGGFRRGSGSQYGPADLVKKGLVVVTIQYRLGSLGFLSTNRKELPGNAGLFDIVASLRFVRQHIQYFGGDANRIIPSGQGSGASAAMMLSFAQFTKGWIKGVFAMSGSAISSFAVDKEPEQTSRSVSAIDSCNSLTEGLEFVRCMQRLPLDTIIRGDDKLQEERLSKDNSANAYITSISKLLNPGPAVEGEDDFRFLPNFLIETPQQALERGDFAKVPLLTGVTKDETSTSAKGGGLATKLLGTVEESEKFLEDMVNQLLQVNTGILGNNALTPLLKQLTSNTNFLKGITKSLDGVASTLDKIIQMTTDALFNLPAFLSSRFWSKQNKAYLYSFEHESQTTTADDFLPDYPLTEQPGETSVEGVGHGDELVYLFDVRSLDGQPVESTSLSDPKDLQVRQHFTDLVAEFAKTGEPKIDGQSVKPFTAQNSDYVIVNSTPSLAQGFRKCQMGLWAGLSEVLKSAECSFLQLGDVVNSLGGGLADVGKGATNTLTKPTANLATGLNNTTGKLTGGLLGGGLLGGKKDQGKPTTQPSLLGLG